MSAKWVRSKQWDDAHIPAWAWPAKVLLRSFSSIPQAVVLLSLVVTYSILASVPIGMLALAPTYLVYLVTVFITVGLVAVLPLMILRRVWKAAPANAAARFIVTALGLIVLSVGAIELWSILLWPRLQYDSVTHSGIRFFVSFADRYKATTLRRLPGFEMSEPEFYSWWPLRVVLGMFVLNMITATIRRIEFTFPNIGVLTVHTGIVTIALGSMYYRGLKLEGDTLLLSGPPGPDGSPNVGPAQDRFYDNQATALWLNQGSSSTWDQRPIHPPRYNDYGLKSAGWPTTKALVAGLDFAGDEGRTLSDRVSEGYRYKDGRTLIDPDLHFNVVGYASYSQPTSDWVRAEPPAVSSSEKLNPVRFIDLRVTFPSTAGPANSAFRFFLLPDQPAGRVSEVAQALSIEWVRSMPVDRWTALTEKLPDKTSQAMVVELPAKEGAAPFRAVLPIEQGKTVSIDGTGYSILIKQLAPTPPFPIITDGYRNASSSVAILRITGPEGKSYDRWVYHRFPEISQDLLDDLNDRGMPKRRDADPAIKITYIDASRLHVFLDEQKDGSVRAAIRLPGGDVKVIEGLKTGSVIEEIVGRRDVAKDPRIDLALGERWDHAQQVERPQIIPDAQRDKSEVGTHTKSMLAVEVSADGKPWKKTVWLPFVRFHHVEEDKYREVTLPDGRMVRMAFGRLARRFPDFLLQLANFEMIAYDHRGSPRDYQSVVRVIPTHDGVDKVAFKQYEHVTRLNAPLQAPFMWSEDRSWFANMAGTLASRLDPKQFKLSQAGWDAEGWRKSQEMVDRGELKRPFASFTILGVGNNPGIHIIALGGILMSIGIPWAFYVKPLILKHRKMKLKAAIEAGEYKKPAPDTIGAIS